jgi:TonB family protein
MAHAEQTRFAAYGAYRLKATYQRNMLWALGIVTGLVILTVGLATVLLGSPVALSSGGPGPREWIPDTTVIILTDDSPFDFPGTEVKPDDPVPSSYEGGVFVPEDDEMWLDESHSGSTNSAGHDFTDSTIEGGSGGGGGEIWLGGSNDTADVLPSITDFVAVERQPELIYSVRPEYPRWVKEAGIEGMVVIKALVSRAGDVLDAVVYVGSGNKLLDEAALAVAGKYKYQPAVQNGRPVAVWVTYKVHFTLAQ